MQGLDDTIAAIATAAGAAGLAVVRVSGPAALATADAVFRGRAPLGAASANTLHHGWAVGAEEGAGAYAAGGAAGVHGADGPATARDASGVIATRDAGSARSVPAEVPPEDVASPRRTPGEVPLDEVVAAVFRAPHSYTREDVVELSCHGGRIAAGRVLAALLRAGARMARPGEFTLRAFLHGRLDLAQAEAVADLIRAETRAGHDLALSQLAGALSRRLDALTGRLTDTLAEIEARVDFAEDVGGIEVPAHAVAALEQGGADLDALLASAPWARAVREGVRVLLAGRPNVGKSSLFNALLGEERAIVTTVPGTTRDLVGERLDLEGVPVTLLDAAGLREGGDEVEAIGIERAREALDACALAIWVVDGAAPLEDEDRAIAARLRGRRVIAALNKADLPARTGAREVGALLGCDGGRVIRVSALRGSGLAALRQAMAEAIGAGAGGGRGSEVRAAGAGDGGAHSADGRAGRAGEGAGAPRGAQEDDAGGGGAPGVALAAAPAASTALLGAVSNARHAEALERARAALGRALAAAREGAPGEIVAFELREALSAAGEVTGTTVGEDLLDRIFSRFCIGK